MSRIFYKKVSLEEVIDCSEVIVEVKKAEPFLTDVLIPIHPDTEKYPPYHKMTFHYKITGILFDGKNLLSIDQIINVGKADENDDFQSHKRYYLEGYSESPIIPTYYPEDNVSYNSEGTIILFLNYLEINNRFRFTLERACEGLKFKTGILKIIDEKKK